MSHYIPTPNIFTGFHFQVLGMRGAGMSVADIARRSGVSIEYIEERMKEICEKVITTEGHIIDAFEDLTATAYVGSIEDLLAANTEKDQISEARKRR